MATIDSLAEPYDILGLVYATQGEASPMVDFATS